MAYTEIMKLLLLPELKFCVKALEVRNTTCVCNIVLLQTHIKKTMDT